MTLSLIILFIYILVISIKEKEIPSSISNTYYKLKYKNWFGFIMWIIGFSFLYNLLNITPLNIQFLVFLSCSGILFVGASPNFKENLEGKIHKVGAILCIVCSLILIGLLSPSLLLIWLLYILYTLIMLKFKWVGNFKETYMLTNPVFWIEMTALIITYLLYLNK